MTWISELHFFNRVKMNSRLCQHHGQSILLDSGWSVETHVVDTLQQLRFPIDHQVKQRLNCLGGGRHTVLIYFRSISNSQSQLLKGLHRVQRRGGVPLQNLHLVSVPHQRAADQFIQQGLFSQVHFVPVSCPASIFSSLRHNVACTGGKPHKSPSDTTTTKR